MSKEFYAPYGEDSVLDGILSRYLWLMHKDQESIRDMFYIDIGCNHPIEASTTYFFYKNLNWSGILIDPSPSLQNVIQETRPRDIFLPVAISEMDGEANLFMFSEHDHANTLDSKFVKEIMLLDKDRPSPKNIRVQTKRLDTIINDNNIKNIFLMNVDTEGKDFEIISAYSWHVRPVFVMVENFEIMSRSPEKRIENFMNNIGYKEIARTYLTSVFVDSKSDFAKVL